MKNRKNAVMIAGTALALFIVLALLSLTSLGPGGGNETAKPKEKLLNAEMKMHDFFHLTGNTYGMAIGEEARVTLRMNSKLEGVNATADVIIPPGFEVVDGTRAWTGLVGENDTTLEFRVRAVKVGVWDLNSNVSSSRGKSMDETNPGIRICVEIDRGGLKDKCLD